MANKDLDDIQFYLYKRGCYIEHLKGLYSEKHHRTESPHSPLFDCLIVVGLKFDSIDQFYRPFIKMKYPETVN